MKVTKRLISAVMAIVIGVSCLGLTAFATSSDAVTIKSMKVVTQPNKQDFYKGVDWKFGYWDFPEGSDTGNFVAEGNNVCFMYNGGKHVQYPDVGMLDSRGLVVNVTYSDGSSKDIAFTEIVSGNTVKQNMLTSPKGGKYIIGENTIEVYFASNTKVYTTYKITIGNLYGDVNGDLKINSSDALLILKHVVELTKLSGVALENADINGDKKINSGDALAVLRIAVGIK